MTRPYGPWTELQICREERGLRKTDVAYLAGISPSYMTRLEEGVQLPSKQMIARIAKALGVRPTRIRRREPETCTRTET